VYVVTRTPTAGGEFQYSRALRKALAYSASVRGYCVDDVELTRAEAEQPGAIPKTSDAGLHSRIRGALLQIRGEALWSIAAKWLSPLHRQLATRRSRLVIYDSPDPVLCGSQNNFIAPVHDLMHIRERRFPEVGGSAERRRRDAVYRHIAARATAVLVDSEVGKNEFSSLYNANPSRVFPLPYVPPPTFDTPRAGAKPAANIPDTFLFYPAQFWLHKNHRNLLEAVATLRLKGLKINVVFCGSSKNASAEIENVIQRANLRDAVTILPFVSDEELIWLYRHARAMVMPTFFGPTSIPPLEAFVLGCPVAISNVYGHVEQLGSAALYFDPGNVDQIASVVKTLWTDNAARATLIERGFEHAARWNTRSFALRFDEILSAVLNSKSTSQ
jgi:glycosyltransferase involved in cell wall biosynthesis